LVRSFSVIALSLLALTAHRSALAQSSSGDIPVIRDTVIARVYTEDPERIRNLSRNYDLWYYIWREGYAVIKSDRAHLPADGWVDESATAELRSAQAPFEGTGTIPDRPCFRTVEQTYSDLQALESGNPQLAQWVDYGDSWEKAQGLGGYDMRALILTNSAVPGPKPVFMVMAASHARELATAEAATRFAELLFQGYGENPDITWMLDYFEVHILAHHNPDGRKMAEAECSGGCSPTWRKNTNQDYCAPGSDLRGADLNRNSSSSFWGGPFSGSSQCGTTYRGPSAASEPETSAMEAYATAVFPDFREAPPNDFITAADENADGAFVSIHSAGDIAFYPWEGSDTVPPNLAGLRALAQKIGFATTFAACQNCFLGPASGTNVDFVYETLGIPSFTFEIGTAFGETCANFESTVLPQTLGGLFEALRHARRSYQTPLGPDTLNLSFTANDGGGLLAATADDTRRAVNGSGEPIDSSQAIAEVRYTVGEPPWLAAESFPMSASDGSFDGPVEDVSATIEAQQLDGTVLVYVYATDAGGNTGPPAAIWVTLGALFKDNFEAP
jgi:carboxypeptidase T